MGPGRAGGRGCEAGALGSVGTAVRSVPELREQWRRLRELTDRPFAINHTGRPFNAEAFEATLESGPAAISFHMGMPADLIAAAHERGIGWLQTVGDVDAAARRSTPARTYSSPRAPRPVGTGGG